MKCGQELKLTRGLKINVSCQFCGSCEGTLDKPGYHRFECGLCGQLFILNGNEKVSLFHDAPQCKNKVLSYLGQTSEADPAIKSSADAMRQVICFIRNRGLGDVIMCTAVLPFIKQQYPDSSIWFFCDDDVADILKENPHIDRVLSVNQASKYRGMGRTYDLLEKVENYTENGGINKRNRLERIVQLCDINAPMEDVRPQLYMTDKEQSWYEDVMGGCDKIVALGLDACASFRSWSMDYFKELISLLTKEEVHVVLLSGQKYPEIFGKNIINATGQLNLRELASTLYASDCLVCGDTGLYHISESMSRPSVVLFGAIPPEARVSTYRNVTALYEPGAASCVPCWDKQLGIGTDVYTCRDKGALCMDAIKPSKVFDEVMQILNKKGG